MLLAQVLNMFVQSDDREWWPVPYRGEDSEPQREFLMTAGVSISGALDDCETEADLQEAIDHTMHLVSCGVLKTMDWAREAQRIEVALYEWIDEIDATLRAEIEAN